MKVLVLLVVFFECTFAEPVRAHGNDLCACKAVALEGYTNPSCECVDKQPSVVPNSLVQYLDVGSTNDASAGVIAGTGCNCSVDTKTGHAKSSCLCFAEMVPCPNNTHNHPFCWPDKGYNAKVTWNGTLGVYQIRANNETNMPLKRVAVAPCPKNSAGWPDCKCSVGYTGSMRWNNKTTSYIGSCLLAECPVNSLSINASCVCNKGYRRSKSFTFQEATWNPEYEAFIGGEWFGSCDRIDCPGNTTKETHPSCECAYGYAGYSLWNATSATWETTCGLAKCPSNTTRLHSTCSCKSGYVESPVDPIVFDVSTQTWAGSCQVKQCPFGTNNDHPRCTCKLGYVGRYSWNRTTQSYDGVCAPAGCPIGGDEGNNCSCRVGYISSSTTGPKWDSVSGWIHTCTLVGCPEGSNSSNPSNCVCDLPGFSGRIIWDGSSWSNCTKHKCPLNSKEVINADGTVGCVCANGFTGMVLWTSNKEWASTCAAVGCPLNAVCDNEKAVALCGKGFIGTVTWSNISKEWQSDCRRSSCPSGSSGFPDCKCSTGFSSGQDSPLVEWTFSGPDSAFTTNCSSVSCPGNSTKSSSGTCHCVRGFTGSIVWQHPNYVGVCKPAKCPPGSVGFAGADCTCPKGFLASTDFGFSQGEWRGQCIRQECPGPFATGFPNCECVRGALKTGGGSVLSWNNVTGWDSSCNLVSCPTNSSITGLCHCDKGYAPYVDGFLSQELTTWDSNRGWRHECRRVDCPAGAKMDTFPNCVCHNGYQGNPVFEPLKESWSRCMPVNCGPNTDKSVTEDGDIICACKVGFSGDSLWNASRQVWNGGCNPAACPVDADCTGVRTATCAKGFRGNVTWIDGAWTSACNPVPCPVNSVNYPDCECSTGYAGGVLRWNGNNYENCSFVPCPGNSSRTESGECLCNDGFVGDITWSNGGYDGSCKLDSCPANSFGFPCRCAYGYTPTPDFGWSRVVQSWIGACQPAACPANSINAVVNCQCAPGFIGDLEWNNETGVFVGECTRVACPVNAFGDKCDCLIGYVGPASWNGTAWTHTCKAAPCPTFSHSKQLASGGISCECDIPYSGLPTWAGDHWQDFCTEVVCPEHSYIRGSDRSKCDCQDGYRGLVRWNSQLQNYDSICRLADCPTPSVLQNDVCVCPPGYSGDCRWQENGMQGEWDCLCGSQQCPSNAKYDAKIKFCACNPGYTGTLSWNDELGAYQGNCTRVPCVPNSTGHPYCQCIQGYSGTIHWNENDDIYEGSCDVVNCPRNSGGNHPVCTCNTGFTDRLSPIAWNNSTYIYDGQCYPVACPPNSTLTGSNPPVCTCNKGFVSNSIDLVGGARTGSCDVVPCPYGGNHPDCSCPIGFNGTIDWVETSPRIFTYVDRCQKIDCPTHAIGDGCVCPSGFAGRANWNSQLQSWNHQCTLVRCPSHSSGFPNCQCDTGYAGSIKWIAESQIFSGHCELIPCPTGSYRRPGVNSTGCDCSVGCSGGYEWKGSNYTGRCSCAACPAVGDCSLLAENPETSQTKFPCLAGYSGRVSWNGQSWLNECKKVDCPVHSSGHPNCTCVNGFQGSVASSSVWQSSTFQMSYTYTSTCTAVPCPDPSMILSGSSGVPTCKCPIGFQGVATWDAENSSFAGSSSCQQIDCPSSEMVSDSSKSLCRCPVGKSGIATWSSTEQAYIGDKECVNALCPAGAVCSPTVLDGKCQTYYTGSYSWNAYKQAWDTNCTLAVCPDNAMLRAFINGTAQGCVCRKGFKSNPTWVGDSQMPYTGCQFMADCPSNADADAYDVKTGARTCQCLKGFSGVPLWDFEATAWIHTCELRKCPDNSTRDENSGLCKCATGFTGSLQWSQVEQNYVGQCLAMIIPAGSTWSVSQPENAVCQEGFTRNVLWSKQEWVNNCQQVQCPENSSRINSTSCSCNWGFVGSLSWNASARNFAGTCQQKDCPSPSTRDEGGRCVCPAGSNGLCKFISGDWACTCSAIIPCPANSSGDSCACNPGYSGSITLNMTTVTSVGEARQSIFVSVSSARIGQCAPVKCPLGTSGHPTCACDSGYAGQVSWISSKQVWNSTCSVKQCPENAENAPNCTCRRGFLGTLSWNMTSNEYSGSCDVAACPEGAALTFSSSGPRCDCRPGYFGLPMWSFVKGWTHSCKAIPCPELSERVEESSVSYEELGNFVGCQKELVNPGFVGNEVEILGLKRKCLGGTESCHALAKQACEKVVEDGGECYGYAISEQSGIQIYSPNAVNKRMCQSANGLLPSEDWIFFRRNAVRVGDCRCIPGHIGGFTWHKTVYIGGCSAANCPAKAECSNIVKCKPGYKGSSKFVWDAFNGVWTGSKCDPVPCAVNASRASFPNCQCAVGFFGEQVWDYKTESWTGSCSKRECPAGSIGRFPECKCKTGYVRSDGSMNPTVEWDYDVQDWKQSCQLVDCPVFADHTALNNCACRSGYRGTVLFHASNASYSVVNGSADGRSCVKVDCPANSTEIGSVVDGNYFPACKCRTGFTGVLSWNSDINSWGKCVVSPCPLHSHGHPNCACDQGYTGEIVWNNYSFHGSCSELKTEPTWGLVPTEAVAQASCSRVRGALGSAASASPEGVLTFTFAGDNSSVSILRCDIKLGNQFSKIKGQFSVVPLTQTPAVNNFLQADSILKPIQNNFEIVNWNPADASSSSSYIAVGTPHTVVDPGREMGSGNKLYASSNTLAIPEASVVSSDTIRIEAEQKFGVTFEIRLIDLQTYNMPVDVIKCTREETSRP